MVHPLRNKAAVSGIGETAYTRGTTARACGATWDCSPP